MATGYEVRAYEDLHRIANAMEALVKTINFDLTDIRKELEQVHSAVRDIDFSNVRF